MSPDYPPDYLLCPWITPYQRLSLDAPGKENDGQAGNGHARDGCARPRLVLQGYVSASADPGQPDHQRKELAQRPLDEQERIEPPPFPATLLSLNLCLLYYPVNGFGLESL